MSPESTPRLGGLLLFGLMASVFSQAQYIKGKVQDARTLESLPFANVFLNNTTIGAATDVKGDFVLKNIQQAGSYELVVSFVGYETFKSTMNFSVGETLVANIKLAPLETELANVEVTATRDVAWEKQLKKFEKVFLGNDKPAASCKIINPYVIDFSTDAAFGKFIAKASAPIEIDNALLGYKVKFYLSVFWSSMKEYFIAGNVSFEEMPSGDTEEKKQWQINRKHAYMHSRHHLFKSIIQHRIAGEGFRMYQEKPDFENTTIRSPNFYSDLGKIIAPYDTNLMVSPATQPGFYKIILKGRVEVHYIKERALVRTYRDLPYQVSWIRFAKDSIIVNKDGFELNPYDVAVSGEMSTDRVARMLPLDYQPDKIDVIGVKIEASVFSQFHEQVYVHTDKPYYYPGETMWFKGYMNYRTPSLRDSLSRTVYVELINPKKSIVLTKTIETDSGVFHGEFILPDSLSPGSYYFRAYTNFSRNFGDENLFLKPIPILNLVDKVNPNQAIGSNTNDTLFTIVPDKRKYKTREQIKLTVYLVDEEDQPLASNLSLSVTDATQVVPVEISNTIIEGYPINETKVSADKNSLPYPIEYGISFNGRFSNEKNEPEKAILNVIQVKPTNFAISRSNENGNFVVSGLSFYDTASFSIQATGGNGAAYGRAELLKRDIPPMNFKQADYKLDISATQTPQRAQSEFLLPKDAKLLKEVVVKGRRIEEPKKYRSYGKADYVYKLKDTNIAYGNLLLALQGKFPGLVVRQDADGNWVVYLLKALTGSLTSSPDILVTINDVFVGGDPGQILGMIDPATVESVELTKRVNVLYGYAGYNGVLSVYTKTGVDTDPTKPTKNLSLIKVPGYSTAREFKSPDYSDLKTNPNNADYRSLIYWNPEVKTDDKSGTAIVSFYASDLPGLYHIVAEGVSQNGKPLRCVYFVEVDGR